MRWGALLLAVAACSHGMTTVPDKLPAHGLVRCSESYGAPIVDTVVGAPALGLGIAVLTQIRSCEECGQLVAPGVMLVIPGVIYGISAIVGYRRAAECREVNEPRHVQAAARTAQLAQGRTIADAMVAAQRGGDCTLVRRLDARLAVVDPELHALVVVDDPGIRACVKMAVPERHCIAGDGVVGCYKTEADCWAALAYAPSAVADRAHCVQNSSVPRG